MCRCLLLVLLRLALPGQSTPASSCILVRACLVLSPRTGRCHPVVLQVKILRIGALPQLVFLGLLLLGHEELAAVFSHERFLLLDLLERDLPYALL